MFYDWRTIVIHFVREWVEKAYKKAISLMIYIRSEKMPFKHIACVCSQFLCLRDDKMKSLLKKRHRKKILNYFFFVSNCGKGKFFFFISRRKAELFMVLALNFFYDIFSTKLGAVVLCRLTEGRAVKHQKL